MNASLSSEKLPPLRDRLGAFFGVAALTAAIPILVALILVAVGVP